MSRWVQDKVDPAEQKRMETRSQLESYVDQLKQQVGVTQWCICGGGVTPE